MSTSFPSRLIQAVDEIEYKASDHVSKLAVLVPSYTSVPTTFFHNFTQLFAHYAQRTGYYPPFQLQTSPYAAQNMRMGIKNLLEVPDWERVLVVEIDMILPQDAFIKHALHTDDIVGSMYFQHRKPFECNVMFRNPKVENKLAHMTAEGMRLLFEKPALYKCDVVGLGCTSIARNVFEKWDPEVPTFINEFNMKEFNDEKIADYNAGGEISHDVYFCQQAAKQGFNVYLDSSIRCRHITESFTDGGHYIAAHPDDFAESKIVVPRAGFRTPPKGKHAKGKIARVS